MTSRTSLLDQCLAIRNLLALSDHYLEQVVNLRQERIESTRLPDLSEAQSKSLEDQYDMDITSTHVQYCDANVLRKELMKVVFDTYSIDQSYWCQFKHLLTVQEALKEIADATGSESDRDRFYRFTKDLYTWLGRITGLGHTPCGRCLLDAEQDRVQSNSELSVESNAASLPISTEGPELDLELDLTLKVINDLTYGFIYDEYPDRSLHFLLDKYLESPYYSHNSNEPDPVYDTDPSKKLELVGTTGFLSFVLVEYLTYSIVSHIHEHLTSTDSYRPTVKDMMTKVTDRVLELYKLTPTFKITISSFCNVVARCYNDVFCIKDIELDIISDPKYLHTHLWYVTMLDTAVNGLGLETMIPMSADRIKRFKPQNRDLTLPTPPTDTSDLQQTTLLSKREYPHYKYFMEFLKVLMIDYTLQKFVRSWEKETGDRYNKLDINKAISYMEQDIQICIDQESRFDPVLCARKYLSPNSSSQKLHPRQHTLAFHLTDEQVKRQLSIIKKLTNGFSKKLEDKLSNMLRQENYIRTEQEMFKQAIYQYFNTNFLYQVTEEIMSDITGEEYRFDDDMDTSDKMIHIFDNFLSHLRDTAATDQPILTLDVFTTKLKEFLKLPKLDPIDILECMFRTKLCVHTKLWMNEIASHCCKVVYIPYRDKIYKDIEELVAKELDKDTYVKIRSEQHSIVRTQMCRDYFYTTAAKVLYEVMEQDVASSFHKSNMYLTPSLQKEMFVKYIIPSLQTGTLYDPGDMIRHFTK